MTFTSKFFSQILGLTALGATVVHSSPSPQPGAERFSHEDIISCDVAVIGGGSSGTYAAVRLQELGKSFVVIEKQEVLGGHTNTYTDPSTGTPADYGVLVYHDFDYVRDYFGRFDIPVNKFIPDSSGNTLYVDFRTGKVLDGYVDPASNQTAFGLAIAEYSKQLAKYPEFAEGNYLPDPVPEDLLMPIGEFIKKYNLEAVASLFYGYAQGFGDFYHTPAVFFLTYFSASTVFDLQNGYLTTTRHNNGELYVKAQERLGSRVLLESTIHSMDRSGSDGRVKLVVQTPSGKKLVRAKRILSTIPPTLDNLGGFDLSRAERTVFGKFHGHGYFTALIKGTGIPDGTTINGRGLNRVFNFPVQPNPYVIVPTPISGVFNLLYGTFNANLPIAKVKKAMVDSLKRLKSAGTVTDPQNPSFVAFNSHSPYELTVSAEDVKNGFYKSLYALQGEKNTYWTGAAFYIHDSSLLWNFTETLLPRVLNGL